MKCFQRLQGFRSNMFTELLDLVISDANAVHQILVTNDRLRKILDEDNQIRVKTGGN
jgi:hypothetical protein